MKFKMVVLVALVLLIGCVENPIAPIEAPKGSCVYEGDLALECAIVTQQECISLDGNWYEGVECNISPLNW